MFVQVTKLSDSTYSFKNLEAFCRSFSWADENHVPFTIESFFIQESSSLSLNIDFSTPITNIYGPSSLPISLLGFHFDVSIEAFFQANIQASEKLFSLAGSLIQQPSEEEKIEKKNKTLLDLCCGSGTIGISLSNLVDNVIGIELIPEAIEDAKKNAMKNGIIHFNLLYRLV